MDDSDTFLYGPQVPVTLSKERKKDRVQGAWPQQDGGLTLIKNCQHERGSLRMAGPMNWSYVGLWGSWWKGEVGGWEGQLLVVLIYWLGINDINSSHHVVPINPRHSVYLKFNHYQKSIYRYIILSSSHGRGNWDSEWNNWMTSQRCAAIKCQNLSSNTDLPASLSCLHISRAAAHFHT